MQEIVWIKKFSYTHILIEEKLKFIYIQSPKIKHKYDFRLFQK
jgi:hypothetical protein